MAHGLGNKHQYHHFYGIVFIMVHVIAISLMYTLMRIVTQDISSSLALFLYKFVILLCIIPWCFADGISGIKTKRIWMNLSRGAISAVAGLCLFYAIKELELSLSDITAVGYLEQVLLVIIGIVYFKELATRTRIITIFISFLGAVIVLYPKLMEFNHGGLIPDFFLISSSKKISPYYIFVFLSVILWATNSTIIKILGKTEKTKVSLFYVNLVSCVIAFPLAFMKWKSFAHIGGFEIRLPYELLNFNGLGLQLHHLKYIAILALCYFAHSIAFFLALKYSDFSVVMPFDYSRLIFTALLGFIFFDEVSSNGSYVGYFLIILSGLFLVKTETRRYKKSKQRQLKEYQMREADEVP